ncbi:hypothetical protein KAR91_73965 [Candidatus Pacearchaeota archaeon]|nr:hypothetical protein [Candidatus Pacearchaeota archaeon]
MGIKGKIEEYAEKELKTRMQPAVEAMGRLEKKLDELTVAIKENTKALKEQK